MQNDNSQTMLKIPDLGLGSTFYYKGKNYKTTGGSTYKWQDGSESIEFECRSGNGKIFLEFEKLKDGKLDVMISRQLKNKSKIEALYSHTDKEGYLNEKIIHEGTEYFLEKRHDGVWKEMGFFTESESFLCYDYFDADQKKFLTVEIWEGDEREYYQGTRIDESEISQITEGKPIPKPNLFHKLLPMLGFIALFGTIVTISNYKNKPPETVIPLKELKDYTKLAGNSKNYSVLLTDMKYVPTENDFYHQYKLIYKNGENIEVKESDFTKVTAANFLELYNKMGMEVGAQSTVGSNKQKRELIAFPPGFASFLNENFGEWNFGTTDTSWQFHRAYQELNNHLYYKDRPPNYTDYVKFKSWPHSKFEGKEQIYGTDQFIKTETGKNTFWGQASPKLRSQALEYGKVQKEEDAAVIRRNQNRYNSRVRSSGGGGK